MSSIITAPGQDQNPQLVLAAGATFLVVDGLLVGLRFLTRGRPTARYAPDDWLALCALLFLIELSTTFIVGVDRQLLGYPMTPAKYAPMQQLELAFQAMQVLCVGFTKLSFVFFYRRIFVADRSHGGFHWATVAVATIIAMWMAATFLAYIFDCGAHVDYIWAPKAVQKMYCLQGLEDENAVAISDFLTDLIVVALPIPMVWRLHMSTQRRISVLLIFGLGIVAVVASVVRMVVYVRATTAEETGIGLKGLDENLLITRGLYWAMVEAGLALMACCLPTLSALLRRKSIESAIRSGLSLMSLGSRGSQRGAATSRDKNEHSQASELESQRSSTNRSHTNIRAGPADKPYVLDDMPPLPGLAGGSENRIYVNHRVEQESHVGTAQ